MQLVMALIITVKGITQLIVGITRLICGINLLITSIGFEEDFLSLNEFSVN